MRKSGSTSVAANASSGNVLAGTQVETPNRPSGVRFAAAAAATGLFGTVLSGSELLMEESHISPANRFPLDPDDVMIKDVAMPGDKLSLAFRNSTGAAIIVQWFVDVVPVR